jgi:hypothetical protein
MLAACGLLYAVNCWRLRLDEVGLARRRLWGWDVWKWDDFESGSFRRHGDGFIASARPWWRRELTFCFLSEADQEFVRAACKFFFRPRRRQDAEDAPGALVVRYQLFRTVMFREDGVLGTMGRKAFDLRWEDVSQVRLVYYDDWSTDARRIELDVPDSTIRIEGIDRVTLPGGDRLRVANPRVVPEFVAVFLERHVPPEKLARHSMQGPPGYDVRV